MGVARSVVGEPPHGRGGGGHDAGVALAQLAHVGRIRYELLPLGHVGVLSRVLHDHTDSLHDGLACSKHTERALR